MASDRPPVPDPIKRDVRRRCGFGCVICGLPIYEYDHMTPYSEVGKHEASNLTLLCPDHHSQKTRGLLAESAVRTADASPANRAAGASRPMAVMGGTQQIAVELGSNLFVSPGGSFAPLVVDGVVLLGVEIQDGQALLHALFFDEYNEPVLQVVASEVVYSVDTWDVEFSGQVLTLRSAPRQIQLRMRFDPQGKLTIDRAELYCNGVRILVDGHSVVAGQQVTMSGNMFQTPIGLAIGWAPPGSPGAGIRMRPSRYGPGTT